MVEHSPHHLKVEGSCPTAAAGGKKLPSTWNWVLSKQLLDVRTNAGIILFISCSSWTQTLDHKKMRRVLYHYAPAAGHCRYQFLSLFTFISFRKELANHAINRETCCHLALGRWLILSQYFGLLQRLMLFWHHWNQGCKPLFLFSCDTVHNKLECLNLASPL